MPRFEPLDYAILKPSGENYLEWADYATKSEKDSVGVSFRVIMQLKVKS